MAKTYHFVVSTGPKTHKRYELTESELEPKHYKMLLGQLVNDWNNCPPRTQHEFIDIIFKRSHEEMVELQKKNSALQEQIKNKIDAAIERGTGINEK